MRQDLPVTSFALLGLLTFGDELTGYELKQRADMTLRFYWVAPAMSQVYSELGRLTEAGLVEPTTVEEGPAGRRTTRYRITPAGQERLTEWMRTSPVGSPVLKHPVALRLLMGHLSDPESLRRMLAEYVEEVSGVLADLEEVRESLRGADGPGQAFYHPALVADWGLSYYASEVATAHGTLRRLAADLAVRSG